MRKEVFLTSVAILMVIGPQDVSGCTITPGRDYDNGCDKTAGTPYCQHTTQWKYGPCASCQNMKWWWGNKDDETKTFCHDERLRTSTIEDVVHHRENGAVTGKCEEKSGRCYILRPSDDPLHGMICRGFHYTGSKDQKYPFGPEMEIIWRQPVNGVKRKVKGHIHMAKELSDFEELRHCPDHGYR